MEKTSEQDQRGGEALLSRVDVVNERDGGLIEAMVPIDLIDRSEVAVNEFHVSELSESMAKETENGIVNGQLTPVLLGQVPGKDTFSIIDGFHRDAAIKRLKRDKIFSTIRLNTSLEEIDDLRILTANSHSSVAFSRIVDWVGVAWERTPWSATVSAAQAFSLANNKAMTGGRIGLTEESAAAIRAWALDKCTRWRIAPGTIYQNMATAQLADPELVAAARQRDSGHRLDELTPVHLKYIARAYPNKFREQQNVATIATENNLTVQETKHVLDILGGVEHDEAVSEILELTDWPTLLEKDVNVLRKRKKPAVTPAPKVSTPKPIPVKRTPPPARNRTPAGQPTSELSIALDALVASHIHIAKLSLKNLVLRGTYTPISTEQPSSPIHAHGVPSGVTESLIVDTTKIPDTLSVVFDELRKPLTRTTMATASLDQDTAEYVVQETFHRVMTDAQSGPLRFAFPRRKDAIVPLVQNGIHDEVRKLSEHAGSQPDKRTIDTIEYADLQIQLPTFRPSGRVAITLFALMDAPESTVGQVINYDHDEVENLKTSLLLRL